MFGLHSGMLRAYGLQGLSTAAHPETPRQAHACVMTASPPRRVAAILLMLTATGLLVLLMSSQYGVAAEYGAGASLMVFAVLPLGVAVVAAGVAGLSRPVTVALAVFCVLTLTATPLAAGLGERARDARAAVEDADFTCNGAGEGPFVPAEVDDAFSQVRHVAPYWLYGPVSTTRLGCTAAIDGPVEESFPAWRRSLLESGWTVEEDGAHVSVVRDGVRLTLYRQDGLSMLHATTTRAGDCEDGRFTSARDGSVSTC